MTVTDISSYWADYELIDSGNFEKLERFGDWVLARPEPQALWDKSLSEKEWDNIANARFCKTRSGTGTDNERGEWKLRKGMPEQWFINYRSDSLSLKFRLGLTAFKHVGLFPEQAGNWEYIAKAVKGMGGEVKPKVLNLFAYTGGASLAAKYAGADVTHVDSVRQVVSWSRENMEASRLNDIRWIVEDAVKFVKRELRRNNTYQGIILDPPAYGRGPDGEKWILEDHLNELMRNCAELLNPGKGFLVLNLYSMGYSALIAKNLLQSHFGSANIEAGELFFTDRSGKRLPLGIFGRIER